MNECPQDICAGIRVVSRVIARPFLGMSFFYLKFVMSRKGREAMKEKLQSIKEEALKAIEAADVPEKLNDVRVKFLGKKGELTAVLKGMKEVAPEERPKVGQLVNETRASIEKILEESKAKMERVIREEKMKQEVIDVTLPSKKNMVGHRHPNTIALEEVERIFIGKIGRASCRERV